MRLSFLPAGQSPRRNRREQPGEGAACRSRHRAVRFDVVGEQLTWTLNNSEMYPPRFNSRWLERLLPLRSEIMEGDLRPLYLGWLCGVRDGFVKNTAPKPPRPKGLNNLTPAQTTLVDFLALKIDASFLI